MALSNFKYPASSPILNGESYQVLSDLELKEPNCFVFVCDHDENEKLGSGYGHKWKIVSWSEHKNQVLIEIFNIQEFFEARRKRSIFNHDHDLIRSDFQILFRVLVSDH